MTGIHIIAGLLALLAGAVALSASKGSRLHRRSGLVFVGAMIVLTTTALVLALFFAPNRVNVVAATLTLYLVCTALLTVRYRAEDVRKLTAMLALIAFATGLRALYLASVALDSPDGLVDQVPAPPLFLFAAVGIFGSLLDARLLLARQLQAAQRLARHLWRMTFALWVATTSFFIGQAKVFPDPLRKMSLLAIPVLIVAAMLIYWLLRVLIQKDRAVKPQALTRP